MRENSTQLVQTMLGRPQASVLMTDAYKFSMAQAGAPLRVETFYLSFRRPGWYVVPFDLSSVVRALCPALPTPEEETFLANYGYELGVEMREALKARPSVCAVPEGSWVREREPILSVTAPSFLASWLEPLLIWLHAPIQIATAAIVDGQRSFCVGSEAEAEVARLALRAVGLEREAHVQCDENAERDGIKNTSQALLHTLDGDASRLFEVGMRGAGTLQSHRLVLRVLRDMGIAQTSNAFLAMQLGLTPVGTTGHEHQLRWGSDLQGFRAVRDLRPQTPSYLFDTYDALSVGIPAAVQVLREAPERPASVRFDSGDYEAQLRAFASEDVAPSYVFMDSMSPQRIADIEKFSESLGVARELRCYGAGGYFRSQQASSYTRDRVSAVYKLSQSGGRAVMKFSDSGKRSTPGRPVVFRRTSVNGPSGYIGQQGEHAPPGYALLTEGSVSPPAHFENVLASPQTAYLERQLRAEKLRPVERELAVFS